MFESSGTEVSPEVGYYLAGFVDGEGSFNVSFKKASDRGWNWRVSACFNVSQRDPHVLYLLRETLGCGLIRDRGDGVYYFEVHKPDDLLGKVIPFFRQYELRSPEKRETLKVFAQICELMADKAHLTREGIEEIVRLRGLMNNETSKRRYDDDDILSTLTQS